MPTLSEVCEIIDNGKLFRGNRLHISKEGYKKISDFLNDATKMITAIEKSDEIMELFQKKPDWQWVFGFVKQELMDIRSCMRDRGSIYRKTQKVVCGDISIHLSNLEVHYPQIEGLAMDDDTFKMLLEKLVDNSSESTITTSEDRGGFWRSL